MATLVRASGRSAALETMCRISTVAPIRSAKAAAWFMAQSATLVKSVGTRIRFVLIVVQVRLLLSAAKIGNTGKVADAFHRH